MKTTDCVSCLPAVPGRSPKVSRAGRRKLAGFALAGTLGFFSSLAAAAAWDVRPTGDPSRDIAAIQAAIDRAHPGDTIRLKAASAAGQFTPFNLGNPTPTGSETRGTILVNKRLTITGELYNSPVSDRTVVNGGFATFFVDTRDPRTGRVDGPVSFAMLESRQAVYSFINCKACSGACITDINVYDPVPAIPDAFAPFGTMKAINVDTTVPAPGYDPDEINGDILVSRCTVDFSNSADGGCSDGICFREHIAKVTVSDSRIINFSMHGIFDVPAAETVSRSGAYDVHGCEMTTTRMFYMLGTGSGFQVGITGGGIAGPVSISNNRISIDTSGFGKSFTAIGIEANGDTGGGSVANNRVTIANASNKLPPGLSGIGFLVGSEFLKLSGNVLSGISSAGFWLFDNIIVTGNDLTGLTITEFAVACLGNGNVVERNAFGPQDDPKMPAIYCEANGNAFNHNDFSGTGLKGFEVSSKGISRAGCLFLVYGTSGNVVNASLSELPQDSSPSYDPCTQIADGSFGLSPGNTINLDFPCDSNQYSQLIHMLNRYADYWAMKLP